MSNELVVMPKDQFAELLRDVINEEIEAQIGPLKAVIAVKQKDACKAAGITDNTARNKTKRGEIEPLQRDGSSLNYFELRHVPGLKPRSNRRNK